MGAGASELGQLLQHLVGSLDRLAVDFIGALRLDHVDQFLGHIDVGGFHVALADHAGAVGARRIGARVAGGGGLGIQVLAAALQAGRIDEGGQLQLADLGRVGAAGLGHRHRAVAADRDALGIGRDGDRGLDHEAAGSHHLALVVDLEGAKAVDAEDIVGIACDIWIPAARPDVIRESNVEALHESVGRLKVYKTTKKFQDYFGISDLNIIKNSITIKP